MPAGSTGGMTMVSDPSSPEAWPQGRLEGRESFREAVRQAIRRMADGTAGTVWWCDPDFADWPLTEATVVGDLQRWMLAGGRLRLLAADFRYLQGHAARFVRWRRDWDHRIDARSLRRDVAAGEPVSVLWTPNGQLRRLDDRRFSCVASSDAGELLRMQEWLQSVWQQGTPAFAATTLGL